MTRTTLTKSLHTVTAVSRLATRFVQLQGYKQQAAVLEALDTLLPDAPYKADDPVLLACMDATAKLCKSVQS